MTFYEFFSGAGMARLGLGRDWSCVFANDDDDAKARSYADNLGREGLVVRDIAKLKLSDLPGAATLAWSSFPCQDISLAADRAGLGAARSGTFWAFWRLMLGLRAGGRAPKLIVIENVTGLLTSHEGRDFGALVGALAEGGYRVGSLVIDAELWLPQSRKRVFVVAIDVTLNVPKEIVAPGPETTFHPPMLVKACSHQTAPIWFKLPVPPTRNMVLADIIEDKPSGPFPQEGIWDTPAEMAKKIAMMTPTNIAKVEAAKRAGKRMVGGLYKRGRDEHDEAGGEVRVQRAEVRFDGVAGCLRMPTGGSSVQTVMIVDSDIVRTRRLSAREAARLMGLPDAYKLPTNYKDAYGLMGDGVAVPAVRFLAEHILEPILKATEAELSGEELLRWLGI
jgi:DNA (cytosine-5)-methyltransferase 1